jgi:hypothetical protein
MSRYGSRTRVGQAVSDFGLVDTIPSAVDYLSCCWRWRCVSTSHTVVAVVHGADCLRSTVTSTGGGRLHLNQWLVAPVCSGRLAEVLVVLVVLVQHQ